MRKNWITGKVVLGLGGLALFTITSLLGCKQFKQFFGFDGTGDKSGAADSPVVVRGGSMTIRTKDKTYGWTQVGMTNTYCANTNSTGYGAFSLDVDETAVAGPIALANGSTLQINGRTFDPNHPNAPPADSSNGVLLTMNSKDCQGGATNRSITLSPASANSTFYPDTGAANENDAVVSAKRFWDQTPNTCVGPTPGVTPQTGDQDTCERAGLITLTVTQGGASTTYRCKYGECIVGF